jgi:hypothetical protein
MSQDDLGMMNVQRFGAKGDGTTDDTAAIQKAIDAAGPCQGAVWFPAGTYLCSRLQMRSQVALRASASWSYHRNGSATLKLVDPAAACLLDLTGTIGARVCGLSLDGGKLGQSVAGIFLDGAGHAEEETLVLEDTRVAHFTGDAVTLKNVWGFTIRNCMFIFCGGNGVTVTHWDGFVYQNIINNCDGYGMAFLHPSGAVTVVGNRIEWNHKGGILIEHGGNYNFTGNYFDRSGGPAITIDGGPNRSAVISITGNIINRSGAKAADDSHACSQILARNVDGLVITGNTMRIGGNDSAAGHISPSYGVVYGGLKNSVIRDNVLHNGATRQLMVDLGGHDDASIVEANVGSLAPAPAK